MPTLSAQRPDPPVTDGSSEPDEKGPARRGPFRPRQLMPARARVQAQSLARLFKLLDAIGVLLVCAMVSTVTAPAPILTGALVMVVGLNTLDAYAFAHREPLSRHLLRVIGALVLAALVALFVALALDPSRSDPAVALGWLGALALAVTILHVLWWRVIARGRDNGRLTPNIIIVGATANATHLIAAAHRSGVVNVIGVFEDRGDRAPADLMGVPVLGDTTALIGHRIMPYVDRVVIAVTGAARARVHTLVERLEVLPNPISLFIEQDDEAARDAALSRIIDLCGAAADDQRALAKRAQDVIMATLGLVIALPVMLATAIAIRLDSPGPVFFRQRRHGFNNEQILVWKFRSMRHEAADATARRQVTADDDRITRVGRFIRKTSLDELPQLINVLKGEMSMVGPRPHAIGMMTGEVESAQLVAQYAHRHRMKPGITGWAAIQGSRGPVDTPELVRTRVALDIEYIERQSFWLDLYIIAMTIPVLLGDRSAVR